MRLERGYLFVHWQEHISVEQVCATVDDIDCCVLLLKWNFIYVKSSK